MGSDVEIGLGLVDRTSLVQFLPNCLVLLPIIQNQKHRFLDNLVRLRVDHGILNLPGLIIFDVNLGSVHCSGTPSDSENEPLKSLLIFQIDDPAEVIYLLLKS